MSRSARPFSREVLTRQRLPYMIAARVQGTGTAAILAGGNELTLVDNGAGDYSISFSQSYEQIPMVMAQSLTANTIVQVESVAKTGFDVKAFQAADGVTATDADFHLMIMGHDAADEV